MRSIHQRIRKLEARPAIVGRETRQMQIILRSVEGTPRMTCKRSKNGHGDVLEIVDYHGMELDGKGGDEEAAFCDWIETVPLDGVEREFTRTGPVCSVRRSGNEIVRSSRPSA